MLQWTHSSVLYSRKVLLFGRFSFTLQRFLFLRFLYSGSVVGLYSPLLEASITPSIGATGYVRLTLILIMKLRTAVVKRHSAILVYGLSAVS